MAVFEETKNTSIKEHPKENHIVDGHMQDDHITITISHSSFTSSIGCTLKESSKEACHLEEIN